MRQSDIRSLFRFVLLSSAVGVTGSGLACGGTVDTRGGSSGSSGGGSSGASGSSSGGSSSTSSSSSSGGSSSGSTSGGSSSGTSGGSCANGAVPFAEEYCCPDGTSCTSRAFGAPDGGTTCEVDCQRICDAVAPGSRAFSCNWAGAKALNYLCGSCGVGRVPAGTVACDLGASLGERLARQAYYEAASVVAFERLLSVLESHGAPPELIERARNAAADETRHAALFAALAEAHGATPMTPSYANHAPTLFELALENATEGCVRETFGALVTLHQADHAETAEVRAAFAAIADDEAEHAGLSWELRAWFDEKLTGQERSMVHTAHVDAVAGAQRDATVPSDALGTALGLPTPERARRMLDTLMDTLGRAA